MTLDDLSITHHFCGGVYIKQTAIPEGVELAQHMHPHGHPAVLVKGDAEVTADGMTQRLRGPLVLQFPAGVAHRVRAVTDVVWLCIWPSDETDPAKVDTSILTP